jgi:hypothetical protein
MNINVKLYLLFIFISTLLSFGVYSQKSFTVEQIQVTGNHKTKQDIIIRELTFKQGDTLASDNIEQILERCRQNIINTNLFLTVEVFYNESGDHIHVFVAVKERWYLVVLPEVYLADRSFNEWWYLRGRDLNRLTYGLTAKHFNLSGNNDQIKFKAMSGFVPYFEVSYAKPYIDKRKRIGIKAGAFYSTQRTMAYRTWNDRLDFFASENRMRERIGALFELRLRNAHYHFHTINLGFTNTTIADTISKLNPRYFGENTLHQKVLSFVYDYRFDRRDNRQYPLKGTLMLTQFNNYFVFKGYNQAHIYGLFGIYQPLGHSLFFESTIRGKVSTPKKQFYPLIAGLGFANNLVRGYELYVIDGQHYALSKNTLKFEALKKTFNLKKFIKLPQFSTLPMAVYPNIYFDFGYTKNYFPSFSKSTLSNELLLGGGVGFDLVTWYNSNIRTSYSINKIGERKFFFGISRDL